MTKRSYPYIPNSVADIKEKMMREIGIETIDELYRDVPEKYLLKKKLKIPRNGLSEFEVKKQVQNLLSKNNVDNGASMFLGAGCWPHYVPAVVQDIVNRSEFLTAYTPYQPEVSQGMLQALFEYQSMICELTGLAVSNCSLYDWASALGEAARMAARVTGKKEILTPKIIHPDRLSVLQVYGEAAGIEIRAVDYEKKSGQLDLNDLRRKISEKTAALYMENPSYLGRIETQTEELNQLAHDHSALFIVGVDPTSLGLLEAPGKYGADMVIGEAQPLGNNMNFGGPMLGIMACQDDMRLIRQMPGRIIGLTTTQHSSRQGFCMTMQTREQHIRREKATSNICTNEALCAVAAAVYLALLGPKGMKELGESILYKTNYAMKLLSKIQHVRAPVFEGVHFKEFTVNFDDTGRTVKEINKKLLAHGIHGGKDLSAEFPELGQTSLYCVTETHSKEEIERMVEAVDEAAGK